MWLVSSFERRSATVAGTRVNALMSEDVTVCDAIELVAWGDAKQHLRHCDYCGEDDVVGDWIAMRRSGARVVFLPAFHEWEQANVQAPAMLDWATNEYAPPIWVAERGLLVCSYELLAEVVPNLPPLDAVPELTEHEVALALQLESGGLLGRFPAAPTPNRSLFVTTSEPSLEEALGRFESLLGEMNDGRRAVLLVDQTEGGIWFWTEDAAGPSHGRNVEPLARYDGRMSLRFEPGIVAVRA